MDSSPEEDLLIADVLTGELGELFRRVSQSREINAADREILRHALFDPKIPPSELLLIDRLYWGLRRGRLRMVD